MTRAILERDLDVVTAEVDGHPRLLHLRSWTYLVLDPVAQRIWELLDEPGDEERLIQALLAEFEGDEARIRAEAGAFLAELRRQEFLVEG